MAKVRGNLQTHIDTFLKTGGKIQVIPIGEGSTKRVKKNQRKFTVPMDSQEMMARARDDRSRPIPRPVPDNRSR